MNKVNLPEQAIGLLHLTAVFGVRRSSSRGRFGYELTLNLGLVAARRDYELQLVDRIKKLSKDNPTYGYRFITELLARDGWRVNRKKVQRIRRAEGLRGH
jgi:hypothetical protein